MPQTWNLPLTGTCRCAQVRFSVGAPALMTMACHCTGCQRMTGSAYSLGAMVPAEALTVLAGEPVIGGLHGATRHLFCPHCMSWLFTQPEGVSGFINVRATLFDDTRWFAPFIETMTCEKLPWARTPAVHSFERWPDADAFEPLIREFAAWAPRF